MESCGTFLMRLIERYGIEFAFGIPGVHTVEPYRGLAATGVAGPLSFPCIPDFMSNPSCLRSRRLV